MLARWFVVLLVVASAPLFSSSSRSAAAEEDQANVEKVKIVKVGISVKGVPVEYPGGKAVYLRIEASDCRGGFVSLYRGASMFLKLPTVADKFPVELKVGARYQFSVTACDENKTPLVPCPNIMQCKLVEENSTRIELERPTGSLVLTGSLADTEGNPEAQTDIWIVGHLFIMPFASSHIWAVAQHTVLGKGHNPHWVSYHARTDKNGQFRFEGLPEGTYGIFRIAQGGKPYRVRHMNGAGAEIALTAPRELSVCVEQPRAVLRGRIVTAEGKPISMTKRDHIRLGKVYARRNSPYGHEESARVDSDGRFEIASLLRDKYFIDVAIETLPIPPGGVSARLTPSANFLIRTASVVDLGTASNAAQDELPVVLPPIESYSLGGVVFVVNDEKTGRMIPNATISLVEGTGNCRLFDNRLAGSSESENGSGLIARLDRTLLPVGAPNEDRCGMFGDGLPVGKYVFFVQTIQSTKETMLPGLFRRIEVSIGPLGTEPDIIHVSLAERKGKGKITGKCKVPDAFGQSRISLYYDVLAYNMETGHGGCALFEEDGRYAIEGLEKGTYAVCLYQMDDDTTIGCGNYNLLSKKTVVMEGEAAQVQVNFDIPMDGK